MTEKTAAHGRFIWLAALGWPVTTGVLAAIFSAYLISHVSSLSQDDVNKLTIFVTLAITYFGDLLLLLADAIVLRRRGYSVKWYAYCFPLLAVPCFYGSYLLIVPIGTLVYMVNRGVVLGAVPWYLLVWLCCYLVPIAIVLLAR